MTHPNAEKDPHAHQPILTGGAAVDSAKLALIMIHGRGASAQGILDLFDDIASSDVVALAPQAAGNTWYPHSFLSPIAANQPQLDSALAKIESIVTDLVSKGFSSERIALLGFSQGACLACEFVARHPRRYHALMGLTGGLIGPVGIPRKYPNMLPTALAGTPVFLGSGDPDLHVPFDRVLETEAVLKRMGAVVEVRRYPGMPHTINQDELQACRTLLKT